MKHPRWGRFTNDSLRLMGWCPCFTRGRPWYQVLGQLLRENGTGRCWGWENPWGIRIQSCGIAVSAVQR